MWMERKRKVKNVFSVLDKQLEELSCPLNRIKCRRSSFMKKIKSSVLD
jgi:hypothetical protein